MLQIINFLFKVILYIIFILIIGIPTVIISLILWESTYMTLGVMFVNFIFNKDKLKTKHNYNNFKVDFDNLIHKYKLD